jgi:phosphohistidine phosphatase SixA
MRIHGLFLLLLVCMIGHADANGTGDRYTLYLVRHAEKLADDGDDPGLTDTGKYRSEQLAHWLGDKGVTDILSSDYRRSRATAEPLASMLGLQLMLYDPHDLPALARNLREARRNALIVGHSNTTPDLARLLCVCFIRDMDDADYDQLIVVSVSAQATQVETLSQGALFPVPGDP